MSNMEITINQIIKRNNDKFQKINIKKVFKLMIYNIYIFLIYILFKLYIIHFLFKDSFNENNLRILQKNNLFFENNTKEEMNITYVLENKKVFHFIENLVEMKFRGKWKNLIFLRDLFGNNDGKLELNFKTPIRYKKYNNFSKSSIDIFFELKDGAYDDYYIKGNFTLNFPDNFAQNLTFIDNIYPKKNKNLKILSIINKNTTIDYASCEILTYCKKHKLNNLTFEITFFPIKNSFSKGFKSHLIFDYTKIELKIYKKKNFQMEFYLEGYNIENDIINARNYTFMVIIINLIQLYYLMNNLKELIRFNEKCAGYDLITIIMSIIIKALISTGHFYKCNIEKDDTICFYFGIISIIYFLDIAVVEVKTLFICFKVNYLDYNDRLYYRTKLMIFGGVFYVFIFLCLVLCRIFIMNFLCCYSLFFFTYFFQILHSIRVGIRPPMSVGYIISSSILKLFFIIYLKAYPYNIFGLQSSYLKSFLVSSTVIVEIIILLLQKEYGPRFLVPEKIRCAYYNYYFDDIKINEHISENPDCIICLDKLKIEEIKNEKDFENNKDKNSLFFVSEKFKNFVEYIKVPFKKKPFMITPCDHIFHTECLEQWLKFKNECPYCKREIPGIG